jgi:hypothetical protein
MAASAAQGASSVAVQIVGTEPESLTLRISGTLSQGELAAAQRAASGRMRAGHRLKVLILVEDFEGWERGGQWDDFSFQAAHDQDIARMAIVGDPRWRELALMFAARDLRQFPIEYFAPERLAEARAWLAAG